MRSTIVLVSVIIAQGAYGYVFPRAIQGFPPLRRSDALSGAGLFKRQCQSGNVCGSGCSPGPCCDQALGLGCRVGEYCTMVNDQVGCCPEGEICTSIRSCTDATTAGCENGGTVDGKLCCDAATPYCNSQGEIQFCQANPLPTAQPITEPTRYPNMTMTTATPTIPPITTTANSTTFSITTTAFPPPVNSTITLITPTLPPVETLTTSLPPVITEEPTLTPTLPPASTETLEPTDTIPPPSAGDANIDSVRTSVLLGGIAIGLFGVLFA